MADRPRLKSPFDDPPRPRAEPSPAQPASLPQRRFRFSIGWLIGLTFLVAFAAAGYGAVTRGGEQHAFYVIFALLTPFLALALASVLNYFKRRSKKRPPAEESPWE